MSNEIKKENFYEEGEAYSPVVFDTDGKNAAMGKMIDEMVSEENKNKEAYSPILMHDKVKDTEEKKYIVLAYYEGDEGEEYNGFDICNGRTECYNLIKDSIESSVMDGHIIDLHRSIVITETMVENKKTGEKRYYFLPLEACVSIYTFCKKMQGIYNDKEFDIDAYAEDFYNEITDDVNPITPDYNSPAAQLMRAAMEHEYTDKASFTGSGNNDQKI